MATSFEDLPGIMDDVADDMESALRAGVLDAAFEVEGEIKEAIYDEFQGRTGALARSFQTSFVNQLPGGGFGAKVVSTLVYAGIQDQGGDIFPRQSKYLTVPVGPGKELPVGTYARDLNLDYAQSGSGTKMLGKASKNGFEPWFILRPSVHLRGREYLRTAEEAAAPYVEEILGEGAETAILQRLP